MAGPAWKGKILESSKKSEKTEKSEVLEGEAFSVKGQKVASGFDCNYLLRSILQKTCKLWMG